MRHDIGVLSDQRYALEVLDQLNSGAMSLRELCRRLHQSKRSIGKALRALAVSGLVAADGTGTWDRCGAGKVPRGARYRHTASGRRLANRLSNFTSWESF